MDRKIFNQLINGKGKEKPMYGNTMGVKKKVQPVFNEFIISKPFKGDALKNLSNLMQPMKRSTGDVGGLLINFNNKKPVGILRKTKVKSHGNLQGMMIKGQGDISGMMIRPKKQRSRVNNGLSGMMVRPKKQKGRVSNGLSSMMISSKNQGINPYMNNTRKGNIAGDMITIKQNNFLKRNKGVKRFFDTDRDGVPDGMDCDYINPKKHGFFSKAKNWAQGEGFKESDRDLREQNIQKDLDETGHGIERYDIAKDVNVEDKQNLSEQTSEMNRWNKATSQSEKDYEKESLDVYDSLKKQGIADDQIAEFGFTENKEKYLNEHPEFNQKYNSELVRKERDEAKEARINFHYQSEVQSGMNKKWGKDVRNYNETSDTVNQQGADVIGAFKRTGQSGYEHAALDSVANDQLKFNQELKQKERDEIDRNILEQREKIDQESLRQNKIVGMRAKIDDLRKGYEKERLRKEQERLKPYTAGTHQLGDYVKDRLVGAGAYRLSDPKPIMKTVKSGKESIEVPTGEFTYTKKADISRLFSKKLGYAFESKDERAKLKEDDYKQRLAKAGMGLSGDKYGKIMKNKGLLPEQKEQRIIQEGERAIKARNKAIALEKKLEPIQKEQMKQEFLLAKVRQAQSKENLTEMAARGRARQKGMFAGLMGGENKQSQQSFPSKRYDNNWVGSDGVRSYDERILPRNRLNGDVEGSLQDQMRKPSFGPEHVAKYQNGLFQVLQSQGLNAVRNPMQVWQQERDMANIQKEQLQKQIETKRYDPEAPRFVYRKKIGGFTRKTDRVKKGEELKINQASNPSQKKRKSSRYPWTKPMQNWERVYVGKGKYVGKGRSKKGTSHKKMPNYKNIKRIKRQPFTPFVRTYGSDAIGQK